MKYGTSSELEKAARQEIKSLKRAQGCPFIVKLVEVLEEDETIYVVMEYCAGGSLSTHVLEHGGYQEDDLRGLVYSLLSGLRHLHRRFLCHNDLQPCNILLSSSGEWKIADFGKASREGQQVSDITDSPYVAPELSEGAACSYESDMWSVGAILIFCLLGRTPTLSTSNMTLRTKLVFLKTEWYKISRLAKKLVIQCLHLDRTLRPSAKQALDYEWLESVAKSSSSSHRRRLSSLANRIVRCKSHVDSMSPLSSTKG
jgi:serine/threonine-protein kinase ULK2